MYTNTKTERKALVWVSDGNWHLFMHGVIIGAVTEATVEVFGAEELRGDRTWEEAKAHVLERVVAAMRETVGGIHWRTDVENMPKSGIIDDEGVEGKYGPELLVWNSVFDGAYRVMWHRTMEAFVHIQSHPERFPMDGVTHWAMLTPPEVVQ